MVSTLCGPPGPGTSLSHAHGVSVVAAAIGVAADIGVDLEENRAADPRTARFFLQGPEAAWLDGASARNDEQLRLWTVKESLYKADPGNSATVLRSYALADPGAKTGYARREPGVVFGYGSVRLGERHLSVAARLASIPQDIQAERSEMDTDKLAQGITDEAVLRRIAEVLAIPVAELDPQTPIRNLVRESFMLVELVVDLQEEFSVYFTQDELRTVKTVGELADLLKASPGSKDRQC
jgi:acyl carrier protein